MKRLSHRTSIALCTWLALGFTEGPASAGSDLGDGRGLTGGHGYHHQPGHKFPGGILGNVIVLMGRSRETAQTPTGPPPAQPQPGSGSARPTRPHPRPIVAR